MFFHITNLSDIKSINFYVYFCIKEWTYRRKMDDTIKPDLFSKVAP